MAGMTLTAPRGWSQQTHNQRLLFPETPFSATITHLNIWHFLPPLNSITPSFRAFIFKISPRNKKPLRVVLQHPLNHPVPDKVLSEALAIFSSRSFLSLYLVTLRESLIQILAQHPRNTILFKLFMSRTLPGKESDTSLAAEASLRAAAAPGDSSYCRIPSPTQVEWKNTPCFWLPGYLQIQAGMFTLLPNF